MYLFRFSYAMSESSHPLDQVPPPMSVSCLLFTFFVPEIEFPLLAVSRSRDSTVRLNSAFSIGCNNESDPVKRIARVICFIFFRSSSIGEEETGVTWGRSIFFLYIHINTARSHSGNFISVTPSIISARLPFF